AMATPAGGPVSAPPVVPAPALPSWPPPTNPTAASGRAGAHPYPTSAPPAADRPVGTLPGGRPGPLPHQNGPGLAGTAYGGTTYGGTEGPGFATVALPQGNPLENSGSLTGHILAQGWAEDAPTTRSSNTKVVIVLAASLGLLIAISLLVVFLANDALSGMTGR
ncbi:hypothetical protein, partial [Micromonospora sicca]